MEWGRHHLDGSGNGQNGADHPRDATETNGQKHFKHTLHDAISVVSFRPII
jgi:hypothetical protein